MLWVKAFHIVFVASWFAGLFYLPHRVGNCHSLSMKHFNLSKLQNDVFRFVSLACHLIKAPDARDETLVSIIPARISRPAACWSNRAR